MRRKAEKKGLPHDYYYKTEQNYREKDKFADDRSHVSNLDVVRDWIKKGSKSPAESGSKSELGVKSN